MMRLELEDGHERKLGLMLVDNHEKLFQMLNDEDLAARDMTVGAEINQIKREMSASGQSELFDRLELLFEYQMARVAARMFAAGLADGVRMAQWSPENRWTELPCWIRPLTL